jgi:DNA-directed RNA polymerase specialized sigma24 family protein
LDIHLIHTRYLQEGTAGFAVIRKFHARYGDVIAKIGFMTTDDLIHDILLSLSRTDLSAVENPDHYILRAVKLRCWSYLDKAIRYKALHTDILLQSNDPDEERDGTIAIQEQQTEAIEEMELIGQVNLFKEQLPQQELRLLNLLIDDADRPEIAQQLGLNINTLDTNIRRLRIRLADFLQRQGYTYSILDRFSKRE